jgi:hypothetical protein
MTSKVGDTLIMLGIFGILFSSALYFYGKANMRLATLCREDQEFAKRPAMVEKCKFYNKTTMPT